MKPTSAKPYHHGDLRPVLLEAAAQLLSEAGIEGLSLRKLAERAGVSRSALYHHFRDKQALLCALACTGFESLQALIDELPEQSADLAAPLRAFLHNYLRFASDNPELYELMFGRILWRNKTPEPQLKTVAYQSFRRYLEVTRTWLGQNGHSDDSAALRVAQASWGTLHGLSRLLIDGIYMDRKDMEAVTDQALALTLAGLRQQSALNP